LSLGEPAGQPRRAIRWFLLVLVIVAVGVGAAILITRVRLLATPGQPMSFSHRAHAEAGVQCLYCHTQAPRSTIAGIPSVERCMGCHKIIATEDEAVQQLAGYWERSEAIPWTPINDQPDFVYFSHQPHLEAGLNCETCHGNVGAMDQTRPTLRMDMGWCLGCHTEQEPEHVARLVDCVTCHQ
jgi:c(7)-type cytochrome triheme protein